MPGTDIEDRLLINRSMTCATPKLRCGPVRRVTMAVLLVVATSAVLHAQSPAPPPAQKSEKLAKTDARTESASEKTGGAKSVAAKRQKLRDCGIKWQEEKKAKGLTGKAAYLKFLSACMKS